MKKTFLYAVVAAAVTAVTVIGIIGCDSNDLNGDPRQLNAFLWSIGGRGNDDGGGTDSSNMVSFTDDRNGKKYRIVTIGMQTWMAENLNYDPADGTGSWCYDDEPENCVKYGRLYDWETANNVCPKGWKLPSRQEWQSLVSYVGGDAKAGSNLRSKGDWPNSNISSTDKYGFSALPGGDRYLEYDDQGDNYSFEGVGLIGLWWTATHDKDNNAYFRYMDSYDPGVGESFVPDYGMDYGLSVRCVRKN